MANVPFSAKRFDLPAFSATRLHSIAGAILAAAFVLAAAGMSFGVMTYQPAPDAECVAEVCGR